MSNRYETLRQLITEAFDEEEIKTICFTFGLEYSDLEGATRATKIVSLIKRLGRTGRLAEFVDWAKRERPYHDWPEADWDSFDWSADEPEPAIVDPNIEPYKGLAYFDYTPEDIRRFFGRKALTAELAQKVHDNIKDADKASFLAIIGASGSGKSSLVRAGIVPALMNQDGFQLHIITPTAKPLETLAASLTRDSESVTATSTLIDDLQKDPRSLHLYVRKLLAQQNQTAEKLLLVIDQFEELFTLCDDEGKRAIFINNLTTAVATETSGATVIILTIRADFYHHCAPYDQLRELLDQQQKYIGNMDEGGLREAIEKPATEAGYSFEAGLVEQILRDVGQEPGSLPLLSHALQETWLRRDGLKLTLGGYREAGGVEGAIAKTADKVYREQLDQAQQAIARTIFLRLTELGEGTQDTRRRADLEELIPQNQQADAVRQVLQALADARLVTTDEGVAEVSHEALIREWPALRSWLDEDREGLAIHRRLTQSVLRWRELNEDEGALYRGVQLEQAKEWADANHAALNTQEKSFLEASLELRKRRSRRRRMQYAGVVVTLIVLVVVSIVAASIFNQQAIDNENLAATAVSAQETAVADRNDAETQRLNAQNAEATAVAGAEQNQTLAQENAAIAATAQAQRDEAESQSRIFLAQSLAALGPVLVQQGESTDYSKLFAIEAIRINRQESGSVNLLADSVLRQALQWPIPNQGLEGHEGAINSVSWSVDGRWVASGGWDSTVRVWDMQNQDTEPVILRGPDEPVHFVAWSPDGRWLATVSGYIAAGDIIGRDATIRIWDTQNWDVAPVVLGGHDDGIYSVSWSPDGQWLASAGHDSTVRIWNTQEWEEQALVLMGHRGSVDSVSWSPNGQWLASSGADGVVRIWDPENWEAEPINLRGHESRVWTVSWNPDSRFLASGGFDGAIRIWDAEDWDATPTVLRDHDDIIRSVVWSPDGRWLASGSVDSTIRVWNSGNWTTDPIILYGHSDAIWSVSWSADGQWLASGSADQIVRVWDAESWPVEPLVLSSFLQYGNTVSWSSNGRWAAAGGYDGTVVVDTQNWDTAPILFTDPEAYVDSVAWSSDGRWLASGGGLGARTSVWVRDSQNWDTEPITLTSQSFSSLSSVSWSHNDRWLAAGSGRSEVGIVEIWDAQDWNLDPIVLTGHEDTVSSVSWSRDDRWLASASHDSTVRIWDTHHWDAKPLILPDHEGWVRAVSWSSDSRWLASAGNDRIVRVWDTQNWGSDPIILAGHEDWVSSLSWSADGRWLASGSADQTIRIWDTQIWDADPIVLTGHVDWVRGVSWSHDSHWLASSSSTLVSSDVRVWASLDQLIEMSCRTVIRNFTWDEWQSYLPDEPYNRTCPNLPVHPTFIESGRELARGGEIEEAITRFEEALELDPTLELDPEQEAMRHAVIGLVEQGRELAREGETEEAIARFEEALALEPTLALDPEQEIKWVLAVDLIEESASLFRAGDIESGVSVLDEAHALVPDLQTLPVEIASDLSANEWNRLCWWGSLWGHAAEVIDACEVAVGLTAEEDVNIRDSRGVALAITNENSASIERAIADFEAFVAHRGTGDLDASLRLEWIEALKAGENPFDNATLEMLRNG